MFRTMRVYHFVFVLLFASSGAHAIEIKTPLEAVEALGHEMSEMRHMLETFVMIGNEMTYKLPKEKLKASIRRYEDMMAGVKKAFRMMLFKSKSSSDTRGGCQSSRLWRHRCSISFRRMR